MEITSPKCEDHPNGSNFIVYEKKTVSLDKAKRCLENLESNFDFSELSDEHKLNSIENLKDKLNFIEEKNKKESKITSYFYSS